MKTRNGFVSNSSSSSFIISSKLKLNSIPVEIEFTEFKILKNLKEYFSYKKESYDEYDEQDDKDLDKVKKAFANGEALYVGNVSTDDEDVASQYLCNHGFPESKTYTIIQNSEY